MRHLMDGNTVAYCDNGEHTFFQEFIGYRYNFASE